MPSRSSLILALILAASGSAHADGPGDGPPQGAAFRADRGASIERSWTRERKLPRRIDSGPGYAGSEYGLGKPAFTGLGSRPDWGRSSAE